MQIMIIWLSYIIYRLHNLQISTLGLNVKAEFQKLILIQYLALASCIVKYEV